MTLNEDQTATIAFYNSETGATGTTWTAQCVASSVCTGLVGRWVAGSFYNGNTITITAAFDNNFVSTISDASIHQCAAAEPWQPLITVAPDTVRTSTRPGPSFGTEERTAGARSTADGSEERASHQLHFHPRPTFILAPLSSLPHLTQPHFRYPSHTEFPIPGHGPRRCASRTILPHSRQK